MTTPDGYAFHLGNTPDLHAKVKRTVRLIGARPLTPTPTDVDETLAHWPPGFRERKQAIADDVARERGHRV